MAAEITEARDADEQQEVTLAVETKESQLKTKGARKHSERQKKGAKRTRRKVRDKNRTSEQKKKRRKKEYSRSTANEWRPFSSYSRFFFAYIHVSH